MKLKLLAIVGLSIFTGAGMLAQTYLVMVKPQDAKEWGYMKLDGTYAIKPQFRKADPFSENGWAAVRNPKSKEEQFININGEVMPIEAKDLILKSFSEGLAPIRKDKKWGYLDETGKIKIEAKYDDASYFDNDHAVVRLGETYMVIDTEGNTVTPPAPVLKMRDIKNGMIPFYTAEKMEGFVNTKGEIAIAAQYNRVGYFNGDLAWARNSNDKIGYINKTGEWVIEPKFDAVKDFPADGNLARVKLDDRWTFVSRTGEIKDLNVEDIRDFHDGLAYGKINGNVGFYNESGEWTIKPQFEAVRDFKNGYAAAKQNGLWGVIDKTGTWVLKPQFDKIKDVEMVK